MHSLVLGLRTSAACTSTHTQPPQPPRLPACYVPPSQPPSVGTRALQRSLLPVGLTAAVRPAPAPPAAPLHAARTRLQVAAGQAASAGARAATQWRWHAPPTILGAPVPATSQRGSVDSRRQGQRRRQQGHIRVSAWHAAPEAGSIGWSALLPSNDAPARAGVHCYRHSTPRCGCRCPSLVTPCIHDVCCV